MHLSVSARHLDNEAVHCGLGTRCPKLNNGTRFPWEPAFTLVGKAQRGLSPLSHALSDYRRRAHSVLLGLRIKIFAYLFGFWHQFVPMSLACGFSTLAWRAILLGYNGSYRGNRTVEVGDIDIGSHEFNYSGVKEGFMSANFLCVLLSFWTSCWFPHGLCPKRRDWTWPPLWMLTGALPIWEGAIAHWSNANVREAST